MSKRDIKAKRWERRKEKRKYGMWYQAQQQFLIATGRRPGKQSLLEIWNREYATAPIVMADAVRVPNGNMREVKSKPAPDRYTS